MTTPQKELNDREIDLRRGKGLGGSTVNNLCGYTIGPKGDYDHWAELAGDDDFNWQSTIPRYKKLQNYKVRASDGLYDKYVKPDEEIHGTKGLLNVEFASEWESSMTSTLDYFEAAGWKLNLDINSGNPLGVGAVPCTAHNGYRQTGASAFLKDAPSNLTVIVDAPVTKILFDGKTAVGVETNSKRCESCID